MSKSNTGWTDALDDIEDGIVALDAKWCYTYLNKKAGKLLGKKPEDLIGKHIWTEFPEGIGQTFYNLYHKAMKTKKMYSFEDYYKPYNTWFENRIYPSPDGIIIFFNDVTEKKKNEQLLLQSKKEIETIINNIGDPIFVKDDQSQIVIVNDAFCNIFNLTKNEIIGKTLAEEVPAKEQEEFLRIDKEVLKTGIENINEETLTIRDGETRHILTKKTRFIDENEQKFLIGIIRDITLRKKAEQELEKSKKYLDNVINNLGDPIFVKDNKSRFLLANQAFYNLFNRTEDEIIGKIFAEDVPQVERERHLKVDKKVLTTGNEIILEDSFVNKNGDTKHIATKKTRFIDEQGNKYLLGVIRDITLLKRTENDLKQAVDFNDRLIMSMQEGLIIVDLEGTIMIANDSACKILGYSRDDITGIKMPYPFLKKEGVSFLHKIQIKVIKGEASSFELEFYKKDGTLSLGSFYSGTIRDDNDLVIALFVTMKDISEEKKTKIALEESVLISNKKKQAVLELTNLLGHDFKSSLSKITELAAKTLNTSRVSVWSFSDNKKQITCENLYKLHDKTFENGAIIRYEDNPAYFNALEERKTIVIKDAQKNNITKKFSKDYFVPNKITSLLDVAIKSSNGHYGIICFEHVGDTVKEWTIDEQEFALSMANIVSLILESNERKAAEVKIKKTNQQLIEANNELNELRGKLERENIYLRNELDLVFNYEEMIYGSPEFSNVLSEVEQVAPTNATVLLLGESGTGKELLARAIHNTSLRNDKPLIKVNCSAIPRELIESELFGHKKGSFTGAFSDRIGKFQLADGGTLFLDEIGELPIDMQPKILRFLQEGEIEVVGGSGSKTLDVRVIAATNRNLKEEIEQNRFREDLYFRLNVFPIEIPALRNRKDDIPLLIEHFMDKFNKAYGKNIKYINDGTMQKLQVYNWPGNIRELENLIERASILSQGDTLVIPGFETTKQKTKQQHYNGQDLSLNNVQRNHITKVLEQCHWKISGPKGAATLLDLKPSTLRDRMNKLGIKKPN